MSCKAELHIGDDFGDNHATMRCQREENHQGPHRENWHPNGDKKRSAVVEWEGDDREENE